MNSKPKTFLSISFGCRVNSAESNQWSQILLQKGYSPATMNPDIVLINTCSITKKGEVESLGKVRQLQKLYPNTKIYVTGCANLDKVKELKNVKIFQNDQKEKLLKELKSSYTPKIKDKYSHTNRFLLKIQSGCSQYCSYCIVPFRRPYLCSLKIEDAIKTVKRAVADGYQEVIITGVNIDEYQYDFNKLLEDLLINTNIKLISFGSLTLASINHGFINLLHKYPSRLSSFLHIPIQSGSDKVLKLMNRPYTKKEILSKFKLLKKNKNLSFGTDIIVGFPTETDDDFLETINLCQEISFTKIHTFKYSPRPGTKAQLIYQNNPIISKNVLKSRSQQIRNLEVK